jgi:hypothetical protein
MLAETVDAPITAHFSEREMACPCCGALDIGAARMLCNVLEIVRLSVGPMTIVSGCRCALHNKRVRGATNSAHLRTQAADVRCFSDRHRFRLVAGALAAGFNRLGVGSGMVHMDCDSSLPPHVVWLYTLGRPEPLCGT